MGAGWQRWWLRKGERLAKECAEAAKPRNDDPVLIRLPFVCRYPGWSVRFVMDEPLLDTGPDRRGRLQSAKQCSSRRSQDEKAGRGCRKK